MGPRFIRAGLLALSLAGGGGAQAGGQEAPLAGEPPHAPAPDAPGAASAPAPPAAPPAAPVSAASLKLILRNYNGGQQVDGVLKRHAWIESMQAYFDSGYTAGPVGIGVSVAPFAALRLSASDHPGNMVVEQDRTAAAFLGEYTVNMRAGETVVRYGLQRVSNPYLESKDNRALPPMFRGLSATSVVARGLTIEAGRFDAVQSRGEPRLQDMWTAYGGTRFRDLVYAGAKVQYSDAGKLALYTSEARDVWRQTYAALAHEMGDPAGIRWTVSADLYLTRDAGAARQGAIDNKAFSIGLSGRHGASTVALAFQRVPGNQYFDYVNDTWGDYLANSSAEDYNTPHEKSLQLRYEFDGNQAGLAGWRFKSWFIAGWGSDARAGSLLYPDAASRLHGLYWRDGVAARGSHTELGVLPVYEWPRGAMKGLRASLLMTYCRDAQRYINAGSWEYNLKLEYPVTVF